jgi:delta24-sterol reductase
VLEVPNVPVGEGFSGTSGGSNSSKHGCFDHIINWLEIVLPAGEIVAASPTEREDLFYEAASSFRTLNIVTLIEMQLIDAGKYVKLTYHSVFSAETAIEKIEGYANDRKGREYLDGIMYTKDTGAVMTGTSGSSGIPQGYFVF